MRRSTLLKAVATLFILLISLSAQAHKYYWRSNAPSNLFTNGDNWTDIPGGGNVYALAPADSDTVYFWTPSVMDSINLNGGQCKEFVVTATSHFAFYGNLHHIRGSLLCPNGNVNFRLGGDIEFTGPGNHTIDMGSTGQRIFALSSLVGGLVFNSTLGAGTYTLQNPLVTDVDIQIVTTNFNTANFPLTCRSLDIAGTAGLKTLNFGTSVVTVAPKQSGQSFALNSPNANTNYVWQNAKFVLLQNVTGLSSAVYLIAGLTVNMAELTFTEGTPTRHIAGLDVVTSSSTLSTLNIGTVHVDINQLSLGLAAMDNVSNTPFTNCTLNVGTWHFARPATVLVDRQFSIVTGAIQEPTGCHRQCGFQAFGHHQLNLVTTAPVTTTSVAYYGVNFGGSGINASSTYDLGFNTGAVSWGGAMTGAKYYWIGHAGEWCDPTKWSFTSNGGPANCVPSPADTAVFDGASFGAANERVMFNLGNGYCHVVDWSATGNKGQLAAYTGGVGTLYVTGSANFSSTNLISANLYFLGKGSHTFRPMTTSACSSPIVRFAGTGTYTLLSPFLTNSVNNYLQHTAGNLNTAGFGVTCGNFSSRSLPELATNLRVLDITNTTLTITGATSGPGRRSLDVSFLTALNAANSQITLTSTDVNTYFLVHRGSTSLTYLNNVVLNNISYTALSGTPLLGVTGQDYTISFNNASFSANAQITNRGTNITHTVTNYNFTSGNTYSFNNSTTITFNILGAINTTTTGCQELARIQSTTPGSSARLNKAVGAFTVNGAMVSDISSVGQTMVVNNGVDAFGNTNVSIGATTGRTMYWVGNLGNWNDGVNHWSIGVSGGTPAITNPLGCIPRAIDDVVFDNSSFTLNNQLVTLNIDGNCRSMLWTPGAAAFAPNFSGSTLQQLNVYGSLTQSQGMVSSFGGRINMLGTLNTVNAQSIDLDRVPMNSCIWLSGNGRYDLLDSVNFVSNSDGIRLNRGKFFSNGFAMRMGGLYLDARGTNTANIANSKITLNHNGANLGTGNGVSYQSLHDAAGTWNAAGSHIESRAFSVAISNTTPVVYHRITMNSANANADISGSSSIQVSMNKVHWVQVPPQANGGSLMSGRFLMDTLIYPPMSTNHLAPGGSRRYTIDDTLIISGTPCNQASLRSSVIGTAAIVASNRCNLDLNFVNLRDINAITCTAAQNHAFGTNEGGNTNWTIVHNGTVVNMGNDTTVTCGVPFVIGSGGFGNIPGMSYLWNTGATTNTITVNTPGLYALTVTYAPNCTGSGDIVISCTPPLAEAVQLRGAAMPVANLLEWDVAAPAAVAQFVLERSMNGIDFQPLGNLPGNAQVIHYAFADEHPFDGASTYRLRIVGQDGDWAHSNAVTLNRVSNGPSIACYPNPSDGQVHVDIQGFGGSAQVVVVNQIGQALYRCEVLPGQNALDLRQLPAGMYTLTATDAEGHRKSIHLNLQ